MISIMTPHKKIFQRILRDWIKEFSTEENVLEIGCGLGDWLVYTASINARVIGLDIDELACKIARNRVKLAKPSIVLYPGRTMPFRSTSIRGIFAHEVIEHIEDDKFFIKEINRILVKGGSFLFTTPNRNKEPLDPHKHAAHVRHYTSEELITLLQENGFIIHKLYWRMHTFCSFLDDLFFRLGNKLLYTNNIQPGLSEISDEKQSIFSRIMLAVYKFLDPFVFSLVWIEFVLCKEKFEGRNTIIIAEKIVDEMG